MTARQRIVEILVQDKKNQLASDANFARHVLTSGFPGFANMSASQLRCMVCDAALESNEGMGLLLREMAQEELLSVLPSRPAADILALSFASADPLQALAAEIRHYFQNEASPAMVKVMLETLGPLAESMRAEDDFKALDTLNAIQLRRLIPVSFALREHVRSLLATLEGQS